MNSTLVHQITLSKKRVHWFLMFALTGVVAALLFGAFGFFSVLRMHSKLVHRNLTWYWTGIVFKNDEEIGFTYNPNAQGYEVLVNRIRNPVKMDRFGFRIPLSYPFDTKIQKHGIIGIGCSFMFGDCIPVEETLTYRLGKALGLPSYNLGVGSYSTVDSYLLLKRNMERFKPALVVYGMIDIHYNRSVCPIPPLMARNTFSGLFGNAGRCH